MANKRMISKEIIDGDDFTELPISSKLLYLEIVVHADDFGFCRSLKILFAISEAGENDLAELEKAGFIFRFDSGVVCVRHWFLHNTIQKDRVHETQFQKELSTLTKINGIYERNTDGNILETDCIQNDSISETELNKLSKLDKANETRAREPCNGSRLTMIDLSDGDHDFEELWSYTFSVYPKKSGAATAKEEWMKKLVPVLPENRFDVAKLLYQGVKAFLDDYLEHHPAEPENERFKYIPKFARWLSEDADYWIKIAEKKSSGDG